MVYDCISDHIIVYYDRLWYIMVYYNMHVYIYIYSVHGGILWCIIIPKPQEPQPYTSKKQVHNFPRSGSLKVSRMDGFQAWFRALGS